MSGNGNGTYNGNGNHSWWQIWKRKPNADFSAYRRLALQLHHSLPRSDNNSRSVLIVTPNESNLCATGGLTLATCIAEELRRPVLLVDATKDAELSRRLGSPGSPGLTDCLSDPTKSLKALAHPTSQENVFFLPRGKVEGSFSAAPENVFNLVTRAAKQWDFIVVAGGPVLKTSLSLAMAPYVGRVLLLVTENRTYLDDITAAENALELCNAKNVSIVLTQLSGSVR